MNLVYAPYESDVQGGINLNNVKKRVFLRPVRDGKVGGGGGEMKGALLQDQRAIIG